MRNLDVRWGTGLSQCGPLVLQARQVWPATPGRETGVAPKEGSKAWKEKLGMEKKKRREEKGDRYCAGDWQNKRVLRLP